MASKAYDDFKELVESTGMTKPAADAYLANLRSQGLITQSEYADAVKNHPEWMKTAVNTKMPYSELEQLQGLPIYSQMIGSTIGHGGYEGRVGSGYLAPTLPQMMQSDTDNRVVYRPPVKDQPFGYEDLMNELGISNTTPNQAAIEAYLNSTPTYQTFANVAGPELLDANFIGEQLNVDPVKLWSANELADLHNIDYNMQNLYDDIKRGTSAQVDLAGYTTDQTLNTDRLNETEERNSYLDSIRLNRANALANGVSAGQRAASDLLNMKKQMTDNTAKRYESAQKQQLAIAEKLKADAQAKLTARTSYDTLAQKLSTDSIGLYANDTARYAQDQASDSQMYAANRALQGTNTLANANMQAAQQMANAQINTANYNSQKAAKDSMAEMNWIYNVFKKSNPSDPGKAVSDMTDYIYRTYSGGLSPEQYTQTKK